MSEGVEIGDVYGDIAGSIIAGGDVKNASLISTGDISGSYNNIVTGGQLIIKQARSAIEELDREAQLAERRLAEAVVNKVNGYTRLIQKSSSTESHNPYKALLDYKLEDAPLFYGRDEAIAALLDHLHQARLTILHAESGAGKSSLLQAGLASRLLAAGHLPLYVRPYSRPPTKAVKKEFLPDVGTLPELERLANMSLEGFLTQVNLHLGESTLYVFLDQFEDFFVELQPDQQKAFATELADCLNEPGLDVRWVLALRKEHFSDLDIFRPHIPAPFENDYFLRTFSREEAKEVITEPAKKRGVDYQKGLVDTILVDLSRDGGRLAPPQVQLVCYTLFDELSQEPDPTRITNALYQKERGRGGSGAKGILSSHLSRVLDRMKARERETARKILEALVTAQARRVIKTKDTLIAELRKTHADVDSQGVEAVLEALVDDRLLRTDEDDKDQPRYELAHDYLLDEIELDPQTRARKAAQEMLNQELTAWRNNPELRIPADKLDIIEAQEAHLVRDEDARTLLRLSREALEEARRRTRRQQQVVRAGAGIVVVLLLLAVFSVVTAISSNRAARDAELREVRAKAAAATATAQVGEAKAEQAIAAADAATAVAQKAEAEVAVAGASLRAEKLNRAGQLVFQGQEAFEDEPLLGLRLALEAWALVPEDDANLRASILPAIQQMASHGRLWKFANHTEDVSRFGGLWKPAEWKRDEYVEGIFYFDDSRLVVHPKGKPSELRRIADGTLVAELSGRLRTLQFTPDPAASYFLAEYDDAPAELRRTIDGTLVTALTVSYAGVVPLSSDPNASYVVIHSRYDYEDDEHYGRELRLIGDGTAVDKPIMGYVVEVVFSRDPDASYFVVGYADTPGELRRTADGSLVATLTSEVEVNRVLPGPGPDSSYFVVGYVDAPGELRRTADGSLVATLTGEINRVFTSESNEDFFVIDYSDAPAEVRRSADGAVVVEGLDLTDTDYISGVSFGPGPEVAYLAVGDIDDDGTLYRIADGTVVESPSGIEAFHFGPSPDTAHFVVDYTYAPGELRRTTDGTLFEMLSGEVRRVYFNPDPDAAYFLVHLAPYSLELRRIDDGTLVERLSPVESVHIIGLGPEAAYFLVDYVSAPGELRHIADGTLVELLSGEVDRVVPSPRPDAAYFLVDYVGGRGEVRCVADGALTERLPGEVSEVKVRQIEYRPDPDPAYYVVAYDDRGQVPAELRRTIDNTLVAEIPSVADPPIQSGILEAFFSPDPAMSYFVVSFWMSGIPSRLHRTTDGSAVEWLTGHATRVEFSPDASYFVVDYTDTSFSELRRSSDGEVIFPELSRSVGGGVMPLTGMFHQIDFIPDPTSTDFVIRYADDLSELWTGQDGLRRLTVLGALVGDIIFFPKKQRLLVEHVDGRAYLVDIGWLKAMGGDPTALAAEELVRLVCQGPFAGGLFDEAALEPYLEDEPPQACR
jgi:hypothetical protein